MLKIWNVAVVFVFTMPMRTFAGFGGMSNVESDGGGAASGPVSPLSIVSVLLGAVAGYYIERALNAAELKKQGADDPSGYLLGGRVGAIIGAIAGPFIVSLLR